MTFHRILTAVRGDEGDSSTTGFASQFGQGQFVYVVSGGVERVMLPPVCLLRTGSREDEILHAALDEQADLLVIGAREASTRRKLARRVAMNAPCSVLVVPQDYPARIRGILAAVDFSPISAGALQVAVSLARQFGLKSVTTMHAYFESEVVSYDEHEEIARDKEAINFLSFLRPLGIRDIEIDQVLEESSSVPNAVQAVVASRPIDLVVMGTRGRSRSAAILLGSQTENMIRETSCPVLAVKQFGGNLRLLEALLDRRVHDRDEPRFG